MISVCLALLIYIYRLIYELLMYGYMKFKKENIKAAREYYFYSLIGSIIYGHGKIKNINVLISKIMLLLCDTLFFIICEKIIILLLCNYNQTLNKQTWILDNTIVCWENTHLFYATINLILLG